MQIKIIPYNENMVLHEINEDFSRLFSEFTSIGNVYLLTGGFCCKNVKGENIVIYRNQASDYLYYLDADITNAFLYFVKEFFNKPNIDIAVTYRLLLIAEKIALDEKKLFKLFNLLKWPASRKGYDYFQALKLFSPALKDKVIMKKAALNDAFLFHNSFKANYDCFITALPDKLTFSEFSQVLRYTAEINIKSDINLLELSRCISNIDKKEVIELIIKKRFNQYSHYLEIFEEFINRFDLPGGCKIVFDQTFEKEEYKLEILFNNFKTLFAKLSQVEKKLDKVKNQKDFKDFFIHKLLFADTTKSGINESNE